GDRCAILSRDDAHWCAAYLGIMACGAVAVPLDTSYSAAQVAIILRAAGARTMFVDARLADVAREAVESCTGVAIRDAHASSSLSTPCDLSTPCTAGTPAVVLYTSGTTSHPKGVILTHANLLAVCDAALG